MIKSVREEYNFRFREEDYQQFLAEINMRYPDAMDFRLAETPVFLSEAIVEKMRSTCEFIIDFIQSTDFLSLTENAIPDRERVAGQSDRCEFMVFDFALCDSYGNGELEPQLIELQGFPSLFGFQLMFPEIMKKHLPVPDNYTQLMSGLSDDEYLSLLKEVILNGHPPEEVILLDIKPDEQKTRIDFYCTREYTGIQPVCLTDLLIEDEKLFYRKDGKKQRVSRIYNRLIFDELSAENEIPANFFEILKPLEVEWVPHPQWYYRISKFLLPLLRHPNIPKSWLLNEVKQIPSDLTKYVLKPLFSFGGQGVIIDISENDLASVIDPENWILQEKVNYADAIQTPDGAAKAEIRLMYIWPKAAARPVLAINLARLSKGKMIGTRYNLNKTWVGGSVAFVQK